MRSFKITVLWESSGHVDVVYHIFSDKHTKSISADDFYDMLSANLSRNISDCEQEARDYITNSLFNEEYVFDMGVGTLLSVEEVHA